MPMFAMASHQYQVVLRVTLPPDAVSLYRARKPITETLFTGRRFPRFSTPLIRCRPTLPVLTKDLTGLHGKRLTLTTPGATDLAHPLTTAHWPVAQTLGLPRPAHRRARTKAR
jgi:hypothetical protein